MTCVIRQSAFDHKIGHFRSHGNPRFTPRFSRSPDTTVAREQKTRDCSDPQKTAPMVPRGVSTITSSWHAPGVATVTMFPCGKWEKTDRRPLAQAAPSRRWPEPRVGLAGDNPEPPHLATRMPQEPRRTVRTAGRVLPAHTRLLSRSGRPKALFR